MQLTIGYLKNSLIPSMLLRKYSMIFEIRSEKIQHSFDGPLPGGKTTVISIPRGISCLLITQTSRLYTFPRKVAPRLCGSSTRFCMTKFNLQCGEASRDGKVLDFC